MFEELETVVDDIGTDAENAVGKDFAELLVNVWSKDE